MKKTFLRLVFLVFAFVSSDAHAQIISTIAGNGISGYMGDGGPATAARIRPVYMAIDNSGNIYLADPFNAVVRKVSTSGIITTFAGTGVAGYSGDGGPASAAQMSHPTGITVDAAGNMYIVDEYQHMVRKINASGIISTFAGNGVGAFGGNGGPATAAQLRYPVDVTTDASGNVYISDAGNYVVRKVNAVGIISTYAGNYPFRGFSGDGGPATNAQFMNPVSLRMDASGNLYIQDNGNIRIRKVNTSGIVTTVVGTGVSGYSGDGGPATAAQIMQPGGITTDASGSIYFTDQSAHRVRMINSAGVITTIAGIGTAGFSGDGGPATAAQISMGGGLFFDAAGIAFY